jgi:hypothetical protein
MKQTQTQKAFEILQAYGYFIGDPEKGAKLFPAGYRGPFLRKYNDAFETKYTHEFEEASARERFFDYWNNKFRQYIENQMLTL